ncbi:Mov34/MPN/PAD-1 family protein [Desulfoferrobacter suflitae]|uniref:Mov34/MPN/PAD-1 family protein n=1 Tax=Desulfoferrobacter suflitae TaxID=2865782 RepID=UPI00216426A3|nr:Mov34/MPN/PAD-1 family protein [Desulfoferrobacter suflitae]MCK8604377.1 Mov34/MPN/PAD-1 family protein [Desulfoferrobacter suflitae]
MLECDLPSGGILRLSDQVLKTFHRFRQDTHSKFESGGILLGRIFENVVSIDQVTTPDSTLDKRGFLFFHRHKGRAQGIINQAFIQSDGEQIYMGEWHTHPQKNPQPSWKDKLEIKRAFRKSRLNLDYLICIIVGNQDEVANIWVGYCDEQGIRQCTQCSA